MGAKRPFQEDNFPELSLKQAKQLGSNKNLNSYFDDLPSHITSTKSDFIGEAESNFFKYQFDERHRNADMYSYSDMDHKESEMSAPLSWVANSSIDKDFAFEDKFCWSHFQGYFDFSVPRRLPVQFEDPYSFLLNCSPRKKVPIGPDHQAEVPSWDPNAARKDNLCPNHVNENEEKLMGTCIFPMPNLKVDGVKEVHHQADCSCLDVGSIQCVQQHVKEAREKLRETISDENFAKLGFLYMGEEVASNWTVEDAQIFQQIIYSYPALLGQKFWKHLFEVFPTRTKKEIVGYYFNVFMLRRRALQNRSDLLAVDSDDDEWHASDGGFYQAGEEDTDSMVESFSDQDVHMVHGDDDSSSGNLGSQKEDYGNAISVGDGTRLDWVDATELNSKEV